MIVHCEIGGKGYTADLTEGVALGLSFGPLGDNPNAFQIPEATISPLVVGDFVGKVANGKGANCDWIQFCAHGNGTHTECIGHISENHENVGDCIPSQFVVADLITVDFERFEGNLVIPLMAMRSLPLFPAKAIIIRSRPNEMAKKHRKWSGNNPPFFETEVVRFLREKGYKHLLTDLPSIDPEEDEGKLEAHHAWWDYNGVQRTDASITEMIYVPDEVKDGLYLLNLQIPKMQSDAVPTNPVIFALKAL